MPFVNKIYFRTKYCLFCTIINPLLEAHYVQISQTCCNIYCAFSFLVPISAQQNLTLPQASQQAIVSQRVGLTDITVNYHRPAVNGREVWGGLVPFDQVWRAGANENTTISFSTEVTVENNKIPAGIYGLHIIPTKIPGQ